MMQRASVDLPQPVSPTRPSVSPRRTVRLTSSTACTNSRRPANTLLERTGKYFFTPVMRSSTSSPSSAAAGGMGSLLTCSASQSGRGRGSGVAVEDLLAQALSLAGVGGQPAGRAVVAGGAHLDERRLLDALLELVGAAGAERASPRQRDEAGRLAWDRP